MPFTIIEAESFVTDGFFREDEFLKNIREHDWSQYADAKVLVRGCGDLVVPPWAFMIIASRLTGVAASVRYGNEHDNIVIYRRSK